MTARINNVTRSNPGADALTGLTIAASAARSLMELAVAKGASPKALAERSRIDPVDLVDGDNRIPFGKYVALMTAGQELCDDPALALHFGEAVDISEVSIAGVVGGPENLGDALAQLNRYARLGVEVEGVGSGDRFRLVRDRSELWLVDTRANPNDFPELTESTFARMVCSVRRLLGERQMFKEVHVTHAEPSYCAEYERIFRVPVVFGTDRNGLRIDEGLMSNFRIPTSSKYVAGVLRERAEMLLLKLDGTQSTRRRVEDLLVRLLDTGGAQMDIVAAKLGLSRPTLFRMLKDEGVTFQQVLDQLRHKTAVRCLEEKLSVKRTARIVGFSDATAFSRAFKRWTGVSPRAFATRI